MAILCCRKSASVREELVVVVPVSVMDEADAAVVVQMVILACFLECCR